MVNSVSAGVGGVCSGLAITSSTVQEQAQTEPTRFSILTYLAFLWILFTSIVLKSI
jgi:hypothetical protein